MTRTIARVFFSSFFSLIFPLFAGAVTALAADAVPHDAGDCSQVFIDRVLVGSEENVDFVLRPARKHPAGPWFNHQWETRPGPAGQEVIYDSEAGIFRSWGTSSYNESPDGLEWSRPVRHPESWAGIRRISVIHDPDDPDPARRFKLVGFGPSAQSIGEFSTDLHPDDPWWFVIGYNTYLSADGRNLGYHSRDHLLTTDEGVSLKERVSGYYDRRLGLYFAFPKTFSRRVRTSLGNHGRFLWSVMTSEDFDSWSEPVPVEGLLPDQRDDDLVLEKLGEVRPLLTFPTDPERLKSQVYAINGPIQLESCTLLLFYMHYRNDHSFNGPSEVQFAVSRDGLNWERPFREPFIPRGRVGWSHASSEWDSGWFNKAGPGVEVGDEVWVYYSARNTIHDHPVGFARGRFSAEERAAARERVGKDYFSGTGIALWQRDRFVSASAGAGVGVLETVPLTFSGNRLEINAETGDEGSVTVELLGAEGQLLGRTKSFTGDELRHRAEWEAPLDLAALASARTPVVLRFILEDAHLFAFAFR